MSTTNDRGYIFASDGQSYVIGTNLERVGSFQGVSPYQNSTSTCVGAGNYQLSQGTLGPNYCPPVCQAGYTIGLNNVCLPPPGRR